MGNCCAAPSNMVLYKNATNLRCLSYTSTSTATTNTTGDDEEHLLRRLPPLPAPSLAVLNPSPSPLPPFLLLGRELGRGEFGITRLCSDSSSGLSFACKSISKSKLRNPVDVADVRREVEIMRRLPASPNIVQLRDAYEDDEAVHFVMEMCEGGELFDRIVARGHYTERAAAGVIRTIVEVVQHCHRNGVMHRDLKPENFLFANEEEGAPLKAIDFGLSVFFEPGEKFNDIVGSPYYMAPEVLKRNYGPEVDIWSAGVILYILLCGVPPFWAETDEGIAQAIIRSHVDFQREPWQKVSETAKDLVMRMIDPNPFTRLTAQEVLDHPWLKSLNMPEDISLGEAVRTRLKQFSTMNKFKKRALRVVAEHLPVEETASIKQLFDIMDTDKNGNLTIEELKEGFQTTGNPALDPDVQMLMDAFDQADIGGDGTLDCVEFLMVTVHLKKISSEEHLLSLAFNFFDKNGSGFIEADDLREALQEKEADEDEKGIKDIILDMDMDKDGRISYNEFTYMMNSGTNWRNASRQYSRAVMSTTKQTAKLIPHFNVKA